MLAPQAGGSAHRSRWAGGGPACSQRGTRSTAATTRGAAIPGREVARGPALPALRGRQAHRPRRLRSSPRIAPRADCRPSLRCYPATRARDERHLHRSPGHRRLPCARCARRRSTQPPGTDGLNRPADRIRTPRRGLLAQHRGRRSFSSTVHLPRGPRPQQVVDLCDRRPARRRPAHRAPRDRTRQRRYLTEEWCERRTSGRPFRRPDGAGRSRL